MAGKIETSPEAVESSAAVDVALEKPARKTAAASRAKTTAKTSKTAARKTAAKPKATTATVKKAGTEKSEKAETGKNAEKIDLKNEPGETGGNADVVADSAAEEVAENEKDAESVFFDGEKVQSDVTEKAPTKKPAKRASTTKTRATSASARAKSKTKAAAKATTRKKAPDPEDEKTEIKGQIVRNLQALELYREQFDQTIDRLASLYVRREKLERQFAKAGSNAIVSHTNKAGARNKQKSPYLTALDEVYTQALTYERELGLTPAALKKINESALHEKTVSPFEKALSGLMGGKVQQ